jgi:hypothetical protein
MVHLPLADTQLDSMPRRRFLRVGLLTTAACALANAPLARPWLTMAHAVTSDAIHETLQGLLAFIVPGPDAYSHAQGVTTSDPGGVDANVAEVLIATLDLSAPFLPSFSGVVAAILNDLAHQVHPALAGPFQAPFANLTYPEKVAVLQLMDATEALQALGGILPAFVAYLCYSDAGTFDPATRTLTGTPVGWSLARYSGVSDGRDELQGYFHNRRHAD